MNKRSQLEEYFGSEKKVELDKKVCTEAISKLQGNLTGSIMICRHNSILVIKNERDQITHIVNPDKERGLVMIESLNEHLSVPRYTPQTAKDWLNDKEAKLTGGDEELTAKMRKCIVSENELSLAVINKLEARVEHFSTILNAYAEVD